MFTLTDQLENEIEIDGETCRLNLFFDTVLLFFDLMNDDHFLDADKIEIAFRMFVDTDDSFDFETKYNVVETIVKRFILDELEEEPADTEAPEESDGDTRKNYDFKKDADFIYASFMQEYGVDLIEQQGKLRWEKFKALLVGLRDKTKFKEIIGIRSMDLPKGKGMEEERRRIRKLKRIYALEKDQQTKEEELDAIFSSLSGGVGNGNQNSGEETGNSG